MPDSIWLKRWRKIGLSPSDRRLFRSGLQPIGLRVSASEFIWASGRGRSLTPLAGNVASSASPVGRGQTF
jgi:hypothetical protein